MIENVRFCSFEVKKKRITIDNLAWIVCDMRELISELNAEYHRKTKVNEFWRFLNDEIESGLSASAHDTRYTVHVHSEMYTQKKKNETKWTKKNHNFCHFSLFDPSIQYINFKKKHDKKSVWCDLRMISYHDLAEWCDIEDTVLIFCRRTSSNLHASAAFFPVHLLALALVCLFVTFDFIYLHFDFHVYISWINGTLRIITYLPFWMSFRFFLFFHCQK